jgi:hypothetical protein
MYTDQTGRFPAKSSSGKYIMVLVKIDSNFIDAEPMKSKTEDAIINAYLNLWKQITASNTVRPKMHMLDNKASDKFKMKSKRTAESNWYHPTLTRETLQNKPSRPFRTTSRQS